MAPADTEPDGIPRGGVHSGCEPAGMDDRDALRIVRGIDPAGFNELSKDSEGLRERSAADRHRRVVVSGGDQLRHLPGLGNGVHERYPGDPVAAESDHRTSGVRGGLEHLEHCLVPQPGGGPAIVGARGATALDMSEDGHAGVLVQGVLQHLPHIGGGDRAAFAVLRSLGHNDQRVATTGSPCATQRAAHPLLPAGRRRILRDEDIVTPAGDGAHQGEVAAVASHHLDDEAPLVACRCAGQGVDGIDDAVQCGVSPDGHVGADQVVVDRADQAGEHERWVGVGHGLLELAGRHQFGQQLAPFRPELIEPGQRAVAADDDQPVDAVFEQIAGRPASPVPLPEGLAAEGADHRPTLVQDSADVLPGQFTDTIAAVHHALEALVDGEHLRAEADGRPHGGTHCGIHALGVTATGQDADPLARTDQLGGLHLNVGGHADILPLRNVPCWRTCQARPRYSSRVRELPLNFIASALPM